MEDLKTGFYNEDGGPPHFPHPATAPSTASGSTTPRLKARSPSPSPGLMMPAITQATLVEYHDVVTKLRILEKQKEGLREELLKLLDANGEVQKGKLFLNITERGRTMFTNAELLQHLGAETFDWLCQQVPPRVTRYLSVSGDSAAPSPEVSDEFAA